MHFDDVLRRLGELGRHQVIVTAFISFMSIITGMSSMSMVFTLAVDDYRCAIPGLSNDTYFSQGDAHDDLVNATIPKGSKCTVYDVGVNGTGEEKECSRWVYDDTIYRPSAVMDFSLVCGRTILRSLGNTAYMVGMLVGSVIGGKMSDRFGRKTALIGGILISSVSGLVLSFAPDIYLFMVFRCILGTAHVSLFGCQFTLLMEIVGPSKRVYATMIVQSFFSVGAMILTPLAFFFRNWRHLTLATVIPSVLLLPYWWLIPESPRWLLSRGRHKEATKILRHMAKVNKRPLSDDVLKSFQFEEKRVKTESFLEMVKQKRLLARLGIVCYLWGSVVAGYYGLHLYSGSMIGDIYVNFTVGVVMDIPAKLFCMLAPLKFGRKAPHVFALGLGAVGCISCTFVVLYVQDEGIRGWLPTTLASIGKLGIAAAFGSSYLYAAELFPTSMRNLCNGICSMCARLTSIVAPFLADLGALIPGPFSNVLPLVVFGAMVMMAGVLSMFLPETHGQRLPETIEEAVRSNKTNREASRLIIEMAADLTNDKKRDNPGQNDKAIQESLAEGGSTPGQMTDDGNQPEEIT